MALAACQTEPATDVTYDAATLHAKGKCEGSYTINWWLEYRKVGASSWQQGPVRTHTCTGQQSGAEYPIADDRITGLADGQHEFRLAYWQQGGSPEWVDSTGTTGGTNYDTFATTAVPSMQAEWSRTFVDSIGINVRTAYAGTNYDDYTQVKSALAYLGIRRIRDGIWPTWETAQHNFLDDLSATTDVKLRMGISELALGTVHIDEKLALIDGSSQHETRLRNLVTSFESVNEPDIYGDEPLCNDNQDNDGDGKTDVNGPGTVDPECASTTDESESQAGQQDTPKWPARMRAYQEHLYDEVKANSLFNGKPVSGPSFATGAEDLVGDLGEWADFGAFHPYPGNSRPGQSVATTRDRCKQYVGNKVCHATEVGYHTEINGGGTGNNGVNEHVQALYTLRMALEHFRQGIPTTDFYNLVEQDPDSGGTCLAGGDNQLNTWDWGWHDCNWNRKEVADAMHNFTTILDSTPVFASPGNFPVTVTGGPADLRTMLLKRADGAFNLVLWRDVSNWHQTNKVEQYPAAASMDVVTGPTVSQVQRFVPNTSASAQQTWTTVRRVPVSVAGAATVLRITP